MRKNGSAVLWVLKLIIYWVVVKCNIAAGRLVMGIVFSSPLF